MKVLRHEVSYDNSVGARARTLAVVLNGLLSVMSEREIIELLSPKNVKGGLKILSERNKS